jgi:hypothetical protein
MLMEVYEQLFDHLFPAYLLSKLDLDPVTLNRLSQLAVAKCEELQRNVQAKNDEVKLLGDQPAVPKIDNKTYCVDCHMKRAGGPPPSLNASDAEYMSLSQERKRQHPSWCPGVCNIKYCTRKHGESLARFAAVGCVSHRHLSHRVVHPETREGQALALYNRLHAERKECIEKLNKATRTCKAIMDYEKSRTGSTNGKKSQLVNGIRNANEYRSAM